MIAPIENLPIEVLLNIFDYLDGKSLKNSALVCKNWNNIISLSTKMMKKFTLNLCNSNVCHFDRVMKLRRKFESIKATLDARNEILVEILSKHGRRVTRLVLEPQFYLYDPDRLPTDFKQIFHKLPFLNELQLYGIHFVNGDCSPLNNTVLLKNLKKLTICRCNWDLLHIFRGLSIAELHIIGDYTATIPNFYLLKRFLEAAVTLETVTLDESASKVFFKVASSSKVCFKLKRLECTLEEHALWFRKGNQITFLESQSSSLKELHLSRIDMSILSSIFKTYKILTKLTLICFSPFHSEQFGSHFIVMEALKILNISEVSGYSNGTLRYSNLDEDCYETLTQQVLRYCPNVEDLSLPKYFHFSYTTIFPFIATHNRKIKTLTISLPKELKPFEEELRFSHLENLEIGGCLNYDFLARILRFNLTIKTLSLWMPEGEDSFNDAIVEALLDHCKLHHVEIIRLRDNENRLEKTKILGA